MQQITTRGIVCDQKIFKEADLLLDIFTLEHGRLPVIFKGGVSRKRGMGSSPLMEGEFQLSKGHGTLWRCGEVSWSKRHLALRDRLETLTAAGEMISAIKETQLEQHPAPLLYRLLASYLSALPAAQDPQALACSFLLKLLRHEGIFSDETILQLELAPEAQTLLATLAYTRRLEDLYAHRIPASLAEQIKHLFHTQFQAC